MQAPVDYPIDDAAHTAEFSIDELMYATLLDRQCVSVATETQTNDPYPLIHFDAVHSATDEPPEQKALPESLASMTQTLLSGEAANNAAGVFSRLRIGSR